MNRIVTVSMAAAALGAALASACGQRGSVESDTIGGEAVAYYGAWSLYRNLAVFFGKRAMIAELNYWRAVGR